VQKQLKVALREVRTRAADGMHGLLRSSRASCIADIACAKPAPQSEDFRTINADLSLQLEEYEKQRQAALEAMSEYYERTQTESASLKRALADAQAAAGRAERDAAEAAGARCAMSRREVACRASSVQCAAMSVAMRCTVGATLPPPQPASPLPCSATRRTQL
jgi:hypothetical protein